MEVLFVLVPAVLAVVGVLMVVGAVREIAGVRSLERTGQETRGRVVASHVKHSSHGSGDSRSVSSRLVETVEFPTLDGRRIRAVPAYSDVGMLDRADMDVRVLYDPARPERFIAPKGPRMGAGAAVGRILFALVFLAFVAGFVAFSQSMLSGSPF